ncbi:MAG: hypothetical protein ACRYGI_13260 [Janthinobacterium lividum]
MFLPDQPLKCYDLRLESGQQIRGLGFIVEGAGLCLGDPDADRVPADVVPPDERLQRLFRKVFRDKLTLELDAVDAVPDHDLTPVRPSGRG